MRRRAGGRVGRMEGKRGEEGVGVVEEVKLYRRCVYQWRLGDCLSPGVQSHAAEMIEKNSTGSLVRGSLLLAQHYKSSPGAV